MRDNQTPFARRRAKELRHSQTDAETKLWGCLRNRSLNGFKFVRQFAVGPYIADFLCRERMLIVEVDGATHGEAHEVASDQYRTNYLLHIGYRIHRVNNADVFDHLTETLDTILLHLEANS